MRKLITSGLLLAFCFLCLLPPAVQAEPVISAQKATEIAKSIITVPGDIKSFRSNYSEYQGRGAWELSWETANGNISVYVDVVNGEINQFYQNDDLAKENSLLPAISQDVAVKKANEFLAKAVPSKYKYLKYREQDVNEISRYNQNYTISYQRVVNNIPYMQNSAYINISSQTGQITNYSLNWDYDVTFPTATGIITKEKASQVLKDNAFELMYYLPYDSKNNKVYLVYGIENPGNATVDAHTGKYSQLSGYYRATKDMAMAEGMGGLGGAPQLNPIEVEEVEAVKSLLSKEISIDRIKKYIDIPQDYKLMQSNLYQDYREKDKRRWNFEWQIQEENKSGYISAAIDAKSGELLSFYKSDYSPDRESQAVNYSYEQAQKIGQEFISKIQPEKTKQIVLNHKTQEKYLQEVSIKYPQPSDIKEATFDYNRIINNIPFYNDRINVTVDLITGQITSYNYNWSNLVFPQPNNLIDIDKAFNNLIKENPVGLDYLAEYNFSKGQENKIVRLNYHFSTSEPRLVDAFKGTLLNQAGDEFKKKTPATLIDIAGHKYENDINTLLKLGVVNGNDENKFFPDNNITNAEIIKMLVLSIGGSPGEGKKIEELGDEWYSPYYQTAIYRKIINKDNLPAPNEELSRMNLSYILMRSLNLEYIAELEGIYQAPVSDANLIKGKDIGFAALTIKLGLIRPQDNKFAPESIMQKGESANTLVQLMKIYKK